MPETERYYEVFVLVPRGAISSRRRVIGRTWAPSEEGAIRELCDGSEDEDGNPFAADEILPPSAEQIMAVVQIPKARRDEQLVFDEILRKVPTF